MKKDSLIVFCGKPPDYPGAVWQALDAAFNVSGFPQSAAGTTALLTGINVPVLLGRHISGFPTMELRKIISENSVYKQIKSIGKNSTFANTYNDAYFRRPLSRQSVTTHVVYAAGLPFRKLDEYRRGKAVFHYLRGEMIRRQGNEDSLSIPAEVIRNRNSLMGDSSTISEDKVKNKNIPILSPVEAGIRIVRLAQDYNFVLFEYVKTDLAGHSQDIRWANSIVNEVMMPRQKVFIQFVNYAAHWS